jgi:glycosyltransferase involved in cell wall biosynthesis
MDQQRLKLLFLSTFPPSPPTFGAQRRLQGLMAALARRHDVSAIAVVSADLDAAAAERAMREYCSEVVLVGARSWKGAAKRVLQLGSMVSARSFVRVLHDHPGLRRVIDARLQGHAYDVVNVEFPYLASSRLARSPAGVRPPRLILDEHNIEFDLARQQARQETGIARRVYNSVNWRKIRREELAVWRCFDGVAFCSAADEARAHTLVPSIRSAVVPNGVDLEFFRPRPGDPSSDGRTLIFFGAINYYPNEDGLRFLLREVWPLIAKSHPEARLKIVGQEPTPEIVSYQGPRIEVAGKVQDVRLHLAGSAVSVVPLRIGGGTRLKVLEAMAMARPVVSTTLGAEGIDAEPGRHLLLADDARAFAAAVGRVLDDANLGTRLGREARNLVVARYSWEASAHAMEELYRRALVAAP